MIRRATWFFAAGSVLLALMLAAVAYGWWHVRQDAARDQVLKNAIAATAVAQAERDTAIARSRYADSVAHARQNEIEIADYQASVLRQRIDSLKTHQPSGDFHGVPEGSEPIGTSWRVLYFITDSILVQKELALEASKAQAKLFRDDRDHWKSVSDDQAKAIGTLNAAVATALHKNDCHIAWVIACPSRKAMLVVGAVVGAGTVLAIQTRGFRQAATKADSRRLPLARPWRVQAFSLPIR